MLRISNCKFHTGWNASLPCCHHIMSTISSSDSTTATKLLSNSFRELLSPTKTGQGVFFFLAGPTKETSYIGGGKSGAHARV